MRVMHVPFTYLPDPPGGTELYVRALARVQQRQGKEVLIAAPAAQQGSYEHEGLRVARYAVAPQLTREQLWGAGDPVAARGFAELLDSFRPDIVHLHAYTSGVSLLCAREIQLRSVTSVFTYHTPSASCPRGTLLRWGRVPCDGILLDHRCGACIISKYSGAPQPAATLVERPLRLLARLLPVTGKLGTGLRLPELVSLRNRANLEFLRLQQRIIVQSNWSQAVLLRNNVPVEQLSLVRQGLLESVTPRPSAPANQDLRIGYFGRLDPDKGLHLLLHALHSQPALRVRVDAYVVAQIGSDAYADFVRELAAKDERITLHPAVARESLADRLAELDAVAVPSLSYETGPLIALEACAVGVPVIGSRVGGVDETVVDGVNGFLVPPDVEAWRALLARLAAERDLLARLRPNAGGVRTIEEVATEVDAVYAQAA